MIKTIVSVVLISILTLNNSNFDIIKNNIVKEGTNKNFEEIIKEEEIVLVEFYATWCKPCNDLAPIIEEIAKEERKTKFVKIDVDNEKELKERYEIFAVPTMVLIKNGKEVDRHVGPLEKQEIKEWIGKK